MPLLRPLNTRCVELKTGLKSGRTEKEIGLNFTHILLGPYLSDRIFNFAYQNKSEQRRTSNDNKERSARENRSFMRLVSAFRMFYLS